MKAKSFLCLAVVAVLFTACKKEEESVREVVHKVFVGDDIDGSVVFPAEGLYGENILSEEVTVIKRGHDYSMCAILPELANNLSMTYEAASVKIMIKVPREEDFYFLYNKGENDVEWRLSRYIPLELIQIYGNRTLPREFENKVFNMEYGYYPSFGTTGMYNRHNDMLVQLLTEEDSITIEYCVFGHEPGKETVSTKTRTLRVE